MFVVLLTRAVQPPVFAVEVKVRRLPGSRNHMRPHREPVDQGVLHFGRPAVLPAIPQVDVVEGDAFGLVGKQRPLQVAGVFVFEIQPERALWLGARPSAVDFEVHVFAQLQRAVCIKKLHAGEPGPRLPEIGAEVGVIVRRIGSHNVDAGVPVPQVRFVHENGERRNVRIKFIDDVDLILHIARQLFVTVVPNPNAQAGGRVEDQSSVGKNRGRSSGEVAVGGVARSVARGCPRNTYREFTVVPARRNG